MAASSLMLASTNGTPVFPSNNQMLNFSLHRTKGHNSAPEYLSFGIEHMLILISLKNTNIVQDAENLFPVTIKREFSSAVAEEKLKMSQQIRGQGGKLGFFFQAEKHKLGRGS